MSNLLLIVFIAEEKSTFSFNPHNMGLICVSFVVEYWSECRFSIEVFGDT